MSARVLIAGVLAGLFLFGWGYLANMVISLGAVGIRSLPPDRQDQVNSVLVEQIDQSGLYLMPGMDLSLKGDALNAEMERWTRAWEAGPTGFLVFNLTGTTPVSPLNLVVQAVIDILIGIAAATVVSFFRPTRYGCRVALVVAIGLIAFLYTNATYMNWYRFPLDYTGARLLDMLAGMLVVGIVVGAIVRPARVDPVPDKTT